MKKIFKVLGLFVSIMVCGLLVSCDSGDHAGKSYIYTPYSGKARDFANLRIYQVMVSSFQDGDSSIGYTTAYGPNGARTGGDLQGIINAADYIKGLGCNAIWMTPIFDSSSGQSISGNHQSIQLDSTGYYAYDFFNVDPKFGTNDKFKELVETFHSKGIYVILDGVFGHWNAVGVKASPSGKLPVRSHGQYDGCDYPASLEFFKEVATYWIKNYKIDGWRLDQCYQTGASGSGTYTGGHNYWCEIRQAVLAAAAENEADESGTTNDVDGKKWGSLGYMVGECWQESASTIQTQVVDGYGLNSCFDFPSRYKLVNAIAREEWHNYGYELSEAVRSIYQFAEEKGYSHLDRYLPNLFITNHDVVRFGDLLTWEHGSDNYWGRTKVALSILAGYSGPITVYYGDEWGDSTGLSPVLQSGGSNAFNNGSYSDNSSRTDGKIGDFSTDQQDLIDFFTKLMKIRSEHEALWNGKVTELSTGTNCYACVKTDSTGSDAVWIFMNNSSSPFLYNLGFEGKNLVDDTDTASVIAVPAYSAMFISKKSAE